MSEDVESLENKTVGITDYFFRFPRTSFIISYLIIFPIFIALVHIALIKIPNIPISLEQSWTSVGIIEYYLYVLLGSAFVMILLAKLAKPSAKTRYLILISAISETIYGIFLLLSNIIMDSSSIIMYIGVGLTIMLWYVISRIIFSIKWRSILYAILQSLLFLIFLISPHMIGISSFSNAHISYNAYILVSIIFLISVYIFLTILNAPTKRTFGLGMTDAVISFTSQWLYGDNDLEDILNSIGQKCNTIVSILSFKQGVGSHSHNYNLVIPNIHYGPFGNLGSSAFSCNIKKLDNKSKSYIAFHGAATHDLNLTTSRESKKIIRMIGNMSDTLLYSKSKIKYAKGIYKNAICDGFVFGDNAFISFSRYPKTTEDISFGGGLSLMNLGKSAGYNTIVIDEHNAETGDVNRFYPGDVEFYEYYKAAENFFQDIKKSRSHNLMVGHSHLDYKNNSMGCGGIDVLALSSKYVLVVFDSNGIKIDFKSGLEKAIKKKYDMQAIIYTTDTHSSNMVKGTLNPIGYNPNEPNLESDIVSSVGQAISKQKSARVAYISKWISVRALGPEQSTGIISTVNASFAILKILTPLFVIIMIAIIIVITLHI